MGFWIWTWRVVHCRDLFPCVNQVNQGLSVNIRVTPNSKQRTSNYGQSFLKAEIGFSHLPQLGWASMHETTCCAPGVGSFIILRCVHRPCRVACSKKMPPPPHTYIHTPEESTEHTNTCSSNTVVCVHAKPRGLPTEHAGTWLVHANSTSRQYQLFWSNSKTISVMGWRVFPLSFSLSEES